MTRATPEVLAAEKEQMICLIQNAVGGCARNWAEVIADQLQANGLRFTEMKPRCQNKCGNCVHSEPLTTDAWIHCKVRGNIHSKSQAACKRFDQKKHT